MGINQSHNPKVAGSSPVLATKLKALEKSRAFFLFLWVMNQDEFVVYLA